LQDTLQVQLECFFVSPLFNLAASTPGACPRRLIIKILVFEFITAGGIAQEQLPESMVREGELMLKALVADLSKTKALQLTVLLDGHFKHLVFPEQIQCIYISATESMDDYLPALIQQNDAVWPIAPESDSVLYDLSVLVIENHTHLLNSNASAVSICADKLRTAEILKSHGIKVVDTWQLAVFSQQIPAPWVVKPKNAEGCEATYLIDNWGELSKLQQSLVEQEEYIIQPYIAGHNLSLSCLFKNGRAWLLCCNRQIVSIQQQQFSLQACEVNVSIDHKETYQLLIDKVANAIPGLWGYVGIDIIHPQSAEPIVLEINPRLTTSFAGISQSLGLNVAEQVINMIKQDPIIEKPLNKQTTVTINKVS